MAKTKSKKPLPEKKEFIYFQMHPGTFDHCINVIISEDLDECASFVNKKFETVGFSRDDFQAQGKVFMSSPYCPILWLPRKPISISEQGTLIHELLHLVFTVTDWAGIRLSPDSEEVYTHLLKYFYKQFYEKLTPNEE